MNRVLLITILSIFFVSCISTARVSDFPQKANAIDFGKYSKEFTAGRTGLWTSNTSNEYYFEKEIDITEDLLLLNIEKALNANAYSVNYKSKDDKCLIAKRGMKANEWNSVTGVYYRLENSDKLVKIYIRTKITQDITGGWRENRAMKVASEIQLK